MGLLSVKGAIHSRVQKGIKEHESLKMQRKDNYGGRAEKQNRKNVEQAQLKGWPGSQLVSWPGIFHPNPCGRLINNMSRCSGCNSVGKISTRDRAKRIHPSSHPCPVPIKSPSPTYKEGFPQKQVGKDLYGGEMRSNRPGEHRWWLDTAYLPLRWRFQSKVLLTWDGMTAWTAGCGHASGLEPTRHLTALALDSSHNHANCTGFP